MSEANKEYEAILVKAKSLLAKGRYSDALKNYEQALNIQSTSESGKIGIVSALINNPEKSVADLNRAKKIASGLINNQPKLPQYKILLADIHAKENKFDLAAELIVEAISIQDSKKSRKLLEQYEAKIGGNQYSKKVSVNKKQNPQALTKKEEYDQLLRAGGVALKDKRYNKAIAIYEQAGILCPQDISHTIGIAKSLMANNLSNEGDYNKAKELLLPIVKSSPKATVVKLLLAENYVKLGDIANARKFLVEAKKLNNRTNIDNRLAKYSRNVSAPKKQSKSKNTSVVRNKPKKVRSEPTKTRRKPVLPPSIPAPVPEFTKASLPILKANINTAPQGRGVMKNTVNIKHSPQEITHIMRLSNSGISKEGAKKITSLLRGKRAENAPTLLRIADVYKQERQYDDAYRYAVLASDLDSSLPEAIMEEADIYTKFDKIDNDKLRELEVRLFTVMSKNPNNDRAFFLMAKINKRQGNMQLANENIDTAISLNKRKPYYCNYKDNELWVDNQQELSTLEDDSCNVQYVEGHDLSPYDQNQRSLNYLFDQSVPTIDYTGLIPVEEDTAEPTFPVNYKEGHGLAPDQQIELTVNELIVSFGQAQGKWVDTEDQSPIQQQYIVPDKAALLVK